MKADEQSSKPLKPAATWAIFRENGGNNEEKTTEAYCSCADTGDCWGRDCFGPGTVGKEIRGITSEAGGLAE